MRFPNPIGRRLEHVRKTYEHKPEVYEKTLAIAKSTAGKEEIDPKSTEDWEEHIPWVASNVAKLAKRRDKGQISKRVFDLEVEKLNEAFADIVAPFVARKTRKPKKKGRRVQLRQMSPKRARQYAERTKLDREKSLGYKTIKKLGGGYTAVVATPNLKAPKYRGKLKGDHIDPDWTGDKAAKKWVAENAPFQQWLGEKMNNCLQFYRVNFVAHGAGKFEYWLRRGGKLYAILNKSGNPVAAILTEPNGNIIETNGLNNQEPRGENAKALERFKIAMWGKKVDRKAFGVDIDRRLVRIIEMVAHVLEIEVNISARRNFIRKARRAARQEGFHYGGAAFRSFMVYILADSKYSALRSLKKADYPKDKKEAEKSITWMTRLISSNAYKGKLHIAIGTASRSAADANKVAAEATEARRVAYSAEAYVAAAAYDADYFAAMQVARAVGGAYLAGQAVARGDTPDVPSVAIDAVNHVVAAALNYANWDAIYTNYAEGLINIMRKEAERGRGPQANPGRRKKVKKVAKKRSSKTKPPTARELVKQCRDLWTHYCERPNKTRLRPVIKHLETMKASSAKTVKEERARCLRAANKEAKKF